MGSPIPTLRQIQADHILWVLTHTKGNKGIAAAILGIDPSTLFRKVRAYGIESLVEGIVVKFEKERWKVASRDGRRAREARAGK